MQYLSDSKWGKYALEKTDTCPKNPRQDGYGDKIPCPYIVRLEYRPNNYYRVLAICWSNVASFYVRISGDRYFLHDYELDELRERLADEYLKNEDKACK